MKKAYRVKKGSEIESIIKKRQSKGNRYFVLYKNENHGNTHFRFAVSVSKKFGNAVHRNKIKRQVREIISKQPIIDKIDIFIVIKTNASELTFNEMKSSIESLITKQKILR